MKHPKPEAGASPHALEPSDGPLLPDELQLAFRSHGMPLEVLRYELTPPGLHYLLVHWDIPRLDATAWRLSVGGRVGGPLDLTLDSIKALPSRTLAVTLECAGNGRGTMRPRPVSVPWLGEAVGTAEWTGVPLVRVLDEARVGAGAVEVVFRGADRGLQGGEDQQYARSLSLEQARRPEVLLAYEMNGRPLEPQHGAPLRLVVPGWYGMASVKWLTSIEVVTAPFEGFQQADAYRYQTGPEDPGVKVERIRVRALMVPPGRPDFFSRHRFLDAGRVTLHGRAWSGHGTVERVQVSVDGRWHEATLQPASGPFAWRGWTFEWDAASGEHELACRASDAAGNEQPLEPPWNYQGMGGNGVQRVAVTVR